MPDMVDKGYQPLALDSAYLEFHLLRYHLDRVIGKKAIDLM